MEEQITITVSDGTREKLRTVGVIMKGLSPEDLLKELALCACHIPHDHGIERFRKAINNLLGRIGI